MRISTLFGRTLRETPADAEMASHRLLLRAGMIRSLSAGIYAYLPLGRRVMKKVEVILCQEMDAIGAQELLMPVVHPAELLSSNIDRYPTQPTQEHPKTAVHRLVPPNNKGKSLYG